jgi:hypothetical protein
MTEAEWLNASDPFGMLAHVAGNASERKLRLFVCACARLVWDHLPDRIMREAVETAERHADGLASDDERQAFIPRLYAIPGNYGNETGATWFGTRSKDDVSAYFLSILATAPWPALASIPNRLAWEEGAKLTRSNQPVLLRDMLGNPLRPIPFDPRWCTSNLLDLSRAPSTTIALSNECQFSPMPSWTPAARMWRSSVIAAATDRTFAGAGS